MNRVRQLIDPIWPTYATIVLAVGYYVAVIALGEPVVENYIIAFIIAVSGAVVSLLWILYRNEQRRRKL